jgi:hypothetical protein
MKKLYLLLILFAPAISFAQWTTSGANVYKSTGNVGIGLTNPSYPLSISANENQTTLGSNTKSVIRLSNGFGSAFGRRFEIQFGLSQLANEQLAVIASEYTTWANGFIGGDLVFGTKQNNSATMFERMRIKWDGNVGIGIATPTSRLDVSGINSDLAILKLRNTAWACNQRTAIEFWNGGNKSYPTSRIVSQMDGCGADGEALLFETQTAGSTASSTKLIIKNNGNVGVGTTSPSAKLQVLSSTPIGADLNSEVLITRFSTNAANQQSLDLKLRKYSTTDNAWWGNGLRLQRNIDDAVNSCYIDFGASETNTDAGSNELGFGLGNTEHMRISQNGSVGIGTTTPGSYKLAVAGKIAATGEVKVFVDGTTTFPDYVFDPSYKLPSLEETEKYVKENHHLPEVPTAADIAKDGMSLNEMNIILLKKVEELTLHLIEMKKEIKELKERK